MNIHNDAFYFFDISTDIFFSLKIKTISLKKAQNFNKQDHPVSDQQSLSRKTDIFLADKCAEYLKTKLGDRIRLNELTREMVTNRNKISRAFKMRFGMTVFDWLREQRMMHALELLETTSLSIMQVAEKVGYPDANNFSTAFRRSMHMSPMQYRKKQKTNNDI